MKLVFAGTPAAAVPSLRALLQSPRHEVAAVLTRPPARSGRGRHERISPVAELARQAQLPVLTPPSPGDHEFLAQLAEIAPDCCPVVAYGALLPPSALGVPRLGWVNLHFSLLPAWRGAAPVQHAILHGDDVTGACTFDIEAGLDTGPVYGLITESIKSTDTAGDLLDRLADSGAALLVATMDGLARGTLVAVPQAVDGVSVAGKFRTEDARVDWATPAQHIDRLIRACTPAPGAWSVFRGERIKLGPIRVSVPATTGDAIHVALKPGELAVSKSQVRVGTASSAVELQLVQPAGKRPMNAADWVRGVRVATGEFLG